MIRQPTIRLLHQSADKAAPMRAKIMRPTTSTAARLQLRLLLPPVVPQNDCVPAILQRTLFSTASVSVDSSSGSTPPAADSSNSNNNETAEKTVPIIFVEPDGTEKEVQAVIGKNLLDAAHDNNVELEGACGGELACSTCHLIFEKDIYDKLPEKLDDEEDMLDLAFEVTETSRLGCQIKVTEDFAGMKVRIPDDGF